MVNLISRRAVDDADSSPSRFYSGSFTLVWWYADSLILSILFVRTQSIQSPPRRVLQLPRVSGIPFTTTPMGHFHFRCSEREKLLVRKKPVDIQVAISHALHIILNSTWFLVQSTTTGLQRNPVLRVWRILEWPSCGDMEPRHGISAIRSL